MILPQKTKQNKPVPQSFPDFQDVDIFEDNWPVIL